MRIDSIPELLERSVFSLWLVLLAWVPIPLASNRPWAWAVLEIGIFILAAAWLLLWAARKVRVPSAARNAKIIGLVWCLWLTWVGLQVIPLPLSWVSVLSPMAAELNQLTLSGADAVPLSLEPQITAVAWLKSLMLGLNFFLALVLLNSRARLRATILSLVVMGVLIAFYGTLVHLSQVSMWYFGTLQQHGNSALGTTGSRNIYANYLVMVLALGIGLLLAQLRGSSARDWRQFFRRLLESFFTTKIVLRLSLCVLVIALTTTHSRMGNTAFFASLIIAGIIGLLLSRHAPKGTVLLLASLVVIDLLIVGSWFGVERLAQRIEQTTVAEYTARQDPSSFVFSQINDFRFSGSGLGTFYTVFPSYRKESVVGYYDYAHNDYAQFAAETGWVGLGFVGLLVLLSFAAAVRAQWVRRDPLMRGMSFASIMGIIAMMIHSWVDFNLQIPANAMLFMLILALGWISLNLDRRAGRSQSRVGRGSS
jgi:putative inorganic carbon (hco3(-)) transporter